MRAIFYIFIFLFHLSCSAQSNNYFFVPNIGQIENQSSDDDPVAYCELKSAVVYLKNNGIRIKVTDVNDIPNIHKSFHFKGSDTIFKIKNHVVDILFHGCNEPSKIEFMQPEPFYHNYYFGNNPKLWKTNIHPSKSIKLKNIYPKIDFLIYTNENGIEFDWIVNPGGNANNILMDFEGQTALNIENNSIQLETSVGKFSIAPPKAYQTRLLTNKKPKNLNCSYQKVNSKQIKLKTQKSDANETLIIDPILVFSTYSGSTADNFGFTATYDTGGCLYAGGIADAESRNYPVTTGAFQTIYGGSFNGAAPVGLPCDITISKYSPDGSKLLFATYLGGSNDEYPHSLCIDPENNLLVFGTTLSDDFPVHQDSFVSNTYKGNFDIIVSKLSSDGSKMLAGTFLGGSAQDGFQINSGPSKSGLIYNYADNYRGDITTDDDGNVYVATCSHSTDFPITSNAFQKNISGRTDALIFSLTPLLSKIRWSTFLGGSNDDAAYSCRFDDSANIFIGGGTKSGNFPITQNNVAQSIFGGVTDGFILKMQKNTGAYESGTFWGSGAYDQIYFIDLDRDGQVYFTGQTEGFIKRTPGVYGKDSTHQFLGRISNDLSVIDILTTFGNRQNGKPELSPAAFMVDDCYNIYFSGWGSVIGVGNNGSTLGLEITSDAHQKSTDNNDFYLLALKKDAKKLVYASYFGGNNSEDHVDGGTSRFDKRGVIYQSVCSSCPNNPPGLNDFPTTANAAFKNNVSIRCSNASFKLDFRLGYSIDATFYASPSTICLGKTNFFKPRYSYNANYYWNFGDGDTSKDFSPSHQYKKIGKYTVSLTITDTNSCNQKAIYTRVINVIETPLPEVRTSKERCIAGIAFEASGQQYDSIFWDFGDNSKQLQNINPVTHVYPTGDFTATIIFKNSVTGCTDTIYKPIAAINDSFEDIKLANVFTPNDDAYNPCFKVIGFSLNCDKGEILIFNRWGEKLYHSMNLTDCWNGRVENTGEPVPSGTYFYIIKVTESANPKAPKQINGSVNLIRNK
jgi:gliding motility-associated-like protein